MLQAQYFIKYVIKLSTNAFIYMAFAPKPPKISYEFVSEYSIWFL